MLLIVLYFQQILLAFITGMIWLSKHYKIRLSVIPNVITNPVSQHIFLSWLVYIKSHLSVCARGLSKLSLRLCLPDKYNLIAPGDDPFLDLQAKKTHWMLLMNRQYISPLTAVCTIDCCFVLMCICSACTNMNGDISLPKTLICSHGCSQAACRTWVNQELISEDNIGVNLLDKRALTLNLAPTLLPYPRAL